MPGKFHNRSMEINSVSQDLFRMLLVLQRFLVEMSADAIGVLERALCQSKPDLGNDLTAPWSVALWC